MAPCIVAIASAGDTGQSEPGIWLKGGGWNEHRFTDQSFPHKGWLDEAAPGHPMLLTRHDGHSGIASSAALELAGITSETIDPPVYQ